MIPTMNDIREYGFYLQEPEHEGSLFMFHGLQYMANEFGEVIVDTVDRYNAFIKGNNTLSSAETIFIQLLINRIGEILELRASMKIQEFKGE